MPARCDADLWFGSGRKALATRHPIGKGRVGTRRVTARPGRGTGRRPPDVGERDIGCQRTIGTRPLILGFRGRTEPWLRAEGRTAQLAHGAHPSAPPRAPTSPSTQARRLVPGCAVYVRATDNWRQQAAAQCQREPQHPGALPLGLPRACCGSSSSRWQVVRRSRTAGTIGWLLANMVVVATVSTPIPMRANDLASDSRSHYFTSRWQ